MRLGWVPLVVGLAGLLSACASSAGGAACDPENPCDDGFACVDNECVQNPDGGGPDAPNGFPDAGPEADAGPVSDARPQAGFGEPCSDKADCASNICIFVNTGGICTETCVGGSCPDEFGCFGVFGAIDPGEVADVCVPESNQLCSPCVMDTECSIIGMDKCLTYDNDKTFCGRDCASVACPTGYACQTVDVNGTDMEQCVPNSGACDCNAALMGNTEDCELTTPLGACDGERTCGGASGWGGCEPPSATDTPDGLFVDDNCDGIDGDYDGGIFVSRNLGFDTGTCGLDHTDPCASIGQGLIRAIISGRNAVYVQASASDYAEVVTMVVGKNIYGGFDANWVRGPHTDAAHRVRISGGLDGTDSQYMTIKARDLIAPTTIADVTILGPDSTGTAGAGTRGTYAVHVSNANLNLERVTIVAGNAADGGGGSTGLPASQASYTTAGPDMRGGQGGSSDEYATACNNSSRGAAGSRGTNSCGTGRDPDGGNAGRGGTMDTDCSCCSYDFDARAGEGGNDADANNVTYGQGGGGGSGKDDCGNPGGGTRGLITNGARGNGGGGGGFLSGGYWYAFAGSGGQTGDHGGGGGGGGGSGGCDIGTDSYGAGGGGGGAGGCRATSGGGGGGGGGGSFAVFAVAGSTVTASVCTITRGNAGDGGGGGPGGHGQRGGPGGAGGTSGNDSKPGGVGGAGGHGGHGGGGGGGGGGISAGFYSHGSTVTESCTISAGSRGDGGLGGISAPLAQAADDDGNDGTTGANGALFGVAVCANPSGC